MAWLCADAYPREIDPTKAISKSRPCPTIGKWLSSKVGQWDIDIVNAHNTGEAIDIVSSLFESDKESLLLVGRFCRPQGGARDRTGYIALPRPGTVRWLVPAERRCVLMASLCLYQPSLLSGKLFKMAIKSLAGLSLLRLIYRDNICLEKCDGELERVFGEANLYYAVFFGTKGIHRKLTLQVMTESGAIKGYVKIADGEKTERLLRHEAEVISSLAEKKISAGLFPRVLYAGELKNRFIIALSTTKGRDSKYTSRLNHNHCAFLAEILNKTKSRSPFDKSEYYLASKGNIATLDPAVRTAGGVDLIRVLDGVAEILGTGSVPFGLRHGDFTPWNTYLDHGQVFAFDWEYAKDGSPPIWDLYHYIIQSALVAQKKTARGALREVESNRGHISDYCALVGVAPYLEDAFLLCYLIDACFAFIGRSKDNEDQFAWQCALKCKEMIQLFMGGEACQLQP